MKSFIQKIQEAEHILNVWLVDNTVLVFEEESQIDTARGLLNEVLDELQNQNLNKGAGSRNRQVNTRIKYRGPEGQGWVGGRGRKPDWILAALKAGKDIKQFEV